MVTVNKPSGSSSMRNTASSVIPTANATSSGVTQASMDALKRKFQRVNQEIVKQNVLLQEHLARNRQEHHQILQENVRLKGRIVALESKLREAEGVCQETKKSIGDRIEILEAIGEHLIDVTKFLRILSLDEDDTDEQKSEFNVSVSSSEANKRPLRKQRNGSGSTSSMQSITEEDGDNCDNDHSDIDVFDLTDHIGDVSLQDNVNEKDRNEKEMKYDDTSTTKSNSRKQPRRK